MLGLIGYQTDLLQRRIVRRSELEAKTRAIKLGHQQLVEMTGRDFGYDVAKWREFMLQHNEEYGYKHPYAFKAVDRAIVDAIRDADLQAFLDTIDTVEPDL